MNNIIYEAIFKAKINPSNLLIELRKFKKDSIEYKILEQRRIAELKREKRAQNKVYSTKVTCNYEKVIIPSGFDYFDFECVKTSRKKNWTDPISTLQKGFTRSNTDPISTLQKGFTRSNSEIISLNCGIYSSRCSFIKYKHSPRVTSYVYCTRKRVIVVLENRVYKIRNAGKNFYFFVHSKNKPIIELVHKKSENSIPLTALDIIHNLPKIRKQLYSLTKKV